jgi:OPA family glycerol-3-phosphate transporter-like MFS transporter/OPA family sugar phosphate sensor protein UhpC-like MFS transporter
MVGYAMFYFVRKNFSFAIPLLNEEYGISNASFGIIMTLGGLIYGLSKFINGILADRTNARWHLVLGLSVCVLTSILFGFADRISTFFTGSAQGESFIQGMVMIMGLLYIVNQIFQGCGFAPCNHLMVSWVPPKELATKMSLWNTSHSVGAFLVAVICGYLTRWQLCFWVPAAIAFVGIFFILITLRDTPKSVGLQELPKVKGELDDGEQKDPKAFRQFLMKKVFLNPVIWVLAITDLFVYIVRFAILDWGPSMLSDMGLSKELTGWTVAIFEIAGCAGMLCAGYISDKFFNSRSQRVCAIEMSLVAACLLGLHFLQDAGHPVFFLILLALAGFLIYGPQALLGVTAANIATKKAASSAVGLIGFMSYLSTIITGVGFGALADKFGGWSWIFITMGGLAVVGAVLILTIWGLKEGSAEE